MTACFTGRLSGRAPNQLRHVTLEAGVARHAEGSCLAKFGDTHVLVTASLEEKVPGWLRGGGKGWVTAEYGMLPRATHTRGRREAAAGKQSGRTQEIQRLIGRGLRSVINLPGLGERQITLDCDVLQADGGTRTASLTGAWVALSQCCNYLVEEGLITASPITAPVAAISVGIWHGEPLLDLDYPEDSTAEADANFVIARTADGSLGLVEVQATGEERPVTEAELAAMLELAKHGCTQLFDIQAKALGL